MRVLSESTVISPFGSSSAVGVAPASYAASAPPAPETNTIQLVELENSSSTSSSPPSKSSSSTSQNSTINIVQLQKLLSDLNSDNYETVAIHFLEIGKNEIELLQIAQIVLEAALSAENSARLVDLCYDLKNKSARSTTASNKQITFGKQLLNALQNEFEIVTSVNYLDATRRDKLIRLIAALHKKNVFTDNIMHIIIHELLLSKEFPIAEHLVALCLLLELSGARLSQTEESKERMDHYFGKLKYLTKTKRKHRNTWRYDTQLTARINKLIRLKEACKWDESQLAMLAVKPQAAPAQEHNYSGSSSSDSENFFEQSIKRFEEMGFSKHDILKCMQLANYDMEKTADFLLRLCAAKFPKPVPPPQNKQPEAEFFNYYYPQEEQLPAIPVRDLIRTEERKNVYRPSRWQAEPPLQPLAPQPPAAAVAPPAQEGPSLEKIYSLHEILSFELTCPITCEVLKEPVMVVETGQTYEKAAIQEWFRRNNTDPVTGVVLHSKQFVPNVAIKKIVDRYKRT